MLVALGNGFDSEDGTANLLGTMVLTVTPNNVQLLCWNYLCGLSKEIKSWKGTETELWKQNVKKPFS